MGDRNDEVWDLERVLGLNYFRDEIDGGCGDFELGFL